LKQGSQAVAFLFIWKMSVTILESPRMRPFLDPRLWSIILLGLIVRLVYAQLWTWIAGDTVDYWELARSIANGQFTLGGQPTAFRPPLYPLFIYLVQDPILLQCLLGAVTCGLLYRITRRLLPPLLYCFAPLTIHYTVSVMTETLFTFLLVLAVYLWLRERLIWCGVVFGLAFLTKPIVLPMLLMGLLISLVLRKHRRAMLIMTAVTVLVAMPWIVRNSLLEHKLTLTQTSALGTNLLYGTFTHEEFGTTIWESALEKYPIRYDLNTDYTREAIHRITSQPATFVKARIEQYPRLLIDTGDHLTSYFPLRVVVIVVQIILGILVLLNLRGQPIQLWLVPLFLTLFHLPLWIEPRYFLPAIPFLLAMLPSNLRAIWGLNRLTSRFASA
jgi:4-amino-4-deoxy-L-arabinose transferase-like glycosyltransferase